jgi:hypothetical protein
MVTQTLPNGNPDLAAPNDDILPSAAPFFDATPSSAAPNGVATMTLPNGNPDLATPNDVIPPSAAPKSVPLVVQYQQKMQKLDNRYSKKRSK